MPGAAARFAMLIRCARDFDQESLSSGRLTVFLAARPVALGGVFRDGGA